MVFSFIDYSKKKEECTGLEDYTISQLTPTEIRLLLLLAYDKQNNILIGIDFTNPRLKKVNSVFWEYFGFVNRTWCYSDIQGDTQSCLTSHLSRHVPTTSKTSKSNL